MDYDLLHFISQFFLFPPHVPPLVPLPPLHWSSFCFFFSMFNWWFLDINKAEIPCSIVIDVIAYFAQFHSLTPHFPHLSSLLFYPFPLIHWCPWYVHGSAPFYPLLCCSFLSSQNRKEGKEKQGGKKGGREGRRDPGERDHEGLKANRQAEKKERERKKKETLGWRPYLLKIAIPWRLINEGEMSKISRH